MASLAAAARPARPAPMINTSVEDEEGWSAVVMGRNVPVWGPVN